MLVCDKEIVSYDRWNDSFRLMVTRRLTST